MNRSEQTIREDAAFLRALAEGSATGSAKDGAILLAVGSLFGLVALQYWAVQSGLLSVPVAFEPWLWLDGLLPFLLAAALISRRFRGQAPGAATRAMSAAWAAVGVSIVFAAIALAIAGGRLGLPRLAPWVFPLVLFTLFGAAWSVAFAARRRRAFAIKAAASYLAAVLCGLVMGHPEEWLVLAGGLFLLVAVPGAGILHASGRAAGSQ